MMFIKKIFSILPLYVLISCNRNEVAQEKDNKIDNVTINDSTNIFSKDINTFHKEIEQLKTGNTNNGTLEQKREKIIKSSFNKLKHKILNTISKYRCDYLIPVENTLPQNQKVQSLFDNYKKIFIQLDSNENLHPIMVKFHKEICKDLVKTLINNDNDKKTCENTIETYCKQYAVFLNFIFVESKNFDIYL